MNLIQELVSIIELKVSQLYEAQWVTTLHLSQEWKQADDDEITVHQLAKAAAKKLKLLDMSKMSDRVRDERDELVDELEGLADDEDADKDDFDNVWSRVYDWADTPLDDKFNGKKVCWINIHGHEHTKLGEGAAYPLTVVGLRAWPNPTKGIQHSGIDQVSVSGANDKVKLSAHKKKKSLFNKGK